ncbi:MAG: carbohydrate ABC transporter permease [Kiloniellales bacterium]
MVTAGTDPPAVTGDTDAGDGHGRAFPLRRLRVRWAWLFLAPSLVAAAAVAGWPLLRTASFAFTDARLSELDAARWIGVENFVAILGDPGWWRAVWNTLVFTVASVSLELVLGLAFALMLNARLRGRPALRAVALVPWAVPTIVCAQMWSWMYHDVYGVLNDLLLRLGVIEAPVAWLADPATAMAAVIMTDVWKATPFMTLLLLAGLQIIPDHVYAAARIDGAGPLRILVHITLPLLRPAIVVALIFRSLDAFRVFDLIYVMTSNSRATATVSVYARQHLIDFQDVGYGSAASLLVFLLVGLISIGYVASLRPATEAAR